MRCVALDAAWPKAHYRLGKALAASGEWHAAAASLEPEAERALASEAAEKGECSECAFSNAPSRPPESGDANISLASALRRAEGD